MPRAVLSLEVDAEVPTAIEVGDLLVATTERFVGPTKTKVRRRDAVDGVRHAGGTVHVSVSTRPMVCGMTFPAETAEVGRAAVDWAATKDRSSAQELASYVASVRDQMHQVQAATVAAAAHAGPPKMPRKVTGGRRGPSPSSAPRRPDVGGQSMRSAGRPEGREVDAPGKSRFLRAPRTTATVLDACWTSARFTLENRGFRNGKTAFGTLSW
ncbi:MULTISPECIES: hypothetical protein [unclassified Isoptericola]|uniref:hypothetical protein n=1 Tax=unclassified Isoptericola TaxID=2623355 RepID=UPI00364A6A16